MTKEKGESREIDMLNAFNQNTDRLEGLTLIYRDRVQCPWCPGQVIIGIVIKDGTRRQLEFHSSTKKQIFISCMDTKGCFGTKSAETFNSLKAGWAAFISGHWTHCEDYKNRLHSERITVKPKEQKQPSLVQKLKKK